MSINPPDISTGVIDTDKAFSLLRDYIHFCLEQKRMLVSEANTYLAILRILPAYSLPVAEEEKPQLTEELKTIWKQMQAFTSKVLIELNTEVVSSMIKH